MKDPLYFWEGRHLLMDTVVHGKRTVTQGDAARLCPYDVRRWIMPPEDEVMGQAWEHLAKAHHRYIASLSRAHRNDALAKAVWHFVVEQVVYTPDEHADFWQFPPETLALRRGDCEDKAFLCASLLLAAGIAADRVRVTLGALAAQSDHGSGLHYEGHSWPMYRNTRGDWCILETCLPHLPIHVAQGTGDPVLGSRSIAIHRAVFLTADRLAADGCREQYVPLVCWNHQTVWSVEPRPAAVVSSAQGLQPNWALNPTFDQILRHPQITNQTR